MSKDSTRHFVVTSCHRESGRARFAVVSAISLACFITVGASAAAAQMQTKIRSKPTQPAMEHPSNEPFGKIPKGPLQLIISVDQQKLHLYSDGTEVAETLVATGVAQHPTPMGVFSVIQKSRLHHSNIYSGAPMPFMQRVTWSGVALHEGVNLGHPASHGCIRMSHDFATRLWVLTHLGARVIIARPELRPEDIADPHLFVHHDEPAPDPMAAADPAKSVKTAQKLDDGKTIDAAGQAKDTADPPAATRDAGQSAQPVPTDKSAALAPLGPNVSRPNDPEGAVAKTAVLTPVPVPAPKPIEVVHASKAPISIFISRKDKKIYVRQDFSPLFDAPVTIERPEQPISTHVFTALEFLGDHSSFRWNVVSLPPEPVPASRNLDKAKKSAEPARKDDRALKALTDPDPPETAQQALARVSITPDVIDQISRLVVPGSSLVISDHGLGDETGEGTDFIVVTRDVDRAFANRERNARPDLREEAADRFRQGPVYRPPRRLYWTW